MSIRKVYAPLSYFAGNMRTFRSRLALLVGCLVRGVQLGAVRLLSGRRGARGLAAILLEEDVGGKEVSAAGEAGGGAVEVSLAEQRAAGRGEDRGAHTARGGPEIRQ